MTASNESKYRAFMSYSHADTASADWLHHALESYRIPAKLVGKQTPIGLVPARLTPIFKDREELAASGDLSSNLQDALAAAQFLIVMASPAAAKSRWVNEEVRAYKQMHGETRVLVVIAAGEPGASELPGREDEECFPPAVRYRVSNDGSLTDKPAEPIAADIREQGDGKKLAKLKLIAGLTGLKLDDLVQREALRRQQRMTAVAAATSALALVMSGLAIVAVRARGEAVYQRAEAEHQRAEADGLVEFMLTDLRSKLEPVGRLDALDVVGQRALKYYLGQKPDSLDADSLGRRSRALHLVGEVRDVRGDSESALAAFKQAAATTSELLERNPGNGQRIFEHAQSVYWVGYVAFQRGENKEAEAAFLDYRQFARQLVKLDPNNADWQMEESYAESNLGTLQFNEGRYAESERAFVSALRIVEAVAARKPTDIARQIDVGQAISWVASARDRLNRTADAAALRRREVAIYENVLKTDSGNMTAKSGLVVVWSSLGRLEMVLGDQVASLKAYSAAIAISRQLLALEPKNSAWRESEIKARMGFADALLFAGERKQSQAEHVAAKQSLDTLANVDPKNIAWNIDLRSRLELLEGSLLAADGRFEVALQRFQSANTRLRTRVNTADFDFILTLSSSALRIGDMYTRTHHNQAAIASWSAAEAAISGANASLHSPVLAVRFAAFTRLGRVEEATSIGATLDQRGYRHPYYLQEKDQLSRLQHR